MKRKYPERKFTLGIPAFERAEYTRQALQSCLDQNYSNYEIIVGDDSRNDEIEKLVNEMNSEKIRYYRNPVQLGLSANADSILQKAEGDWMVFVANDDKLQPDYLQSVNRLIHDYPSASLVRTQYQFIDEFGKPFGKDRNAKFKMTPYEFLSELFLPPSEAAWFSITGVAFPVAVLRENGGIEDFHRGYYIDRIACAQAAKLGAAYFIDKPLASIRFHRSEITTTADGDYEKAVNSTLKMKRIVEDILDSLERQIESPVDKEHLDLARQRLSEHAVRQLKRSFDDGILMRLSQNKIRSRNDFSVLQTKMKSLNVGTFPSLYFYFLAVCLPRNLRQVLLEWFKEYKFMRWHRWNIPKQEKAFAIC